MRNRYQNLLVVGAISLTLTHCAVNLFGLDFPNVELIEGQQPGMPFVHEQPKVLLGCEGVTSDSEDDPCHHKNLRLQTTHQGRVKTDIPIYGVLTQPYLDQSENPDEMGMFPFAGTTDEALKGTFIAMSHVKFLEAAGARVVPISYKYDKNQLYQILEQVNGVYIPGDSPLVTYNKRFLATVHEIITWAQNHNVLDPTAHFPVVGVSYGYMAMMMTAVQRENTIQPMDDELIGTSLEMNLRLKPEQTYLFDGMTLEEAESTLNNVTFYNQLSFNIPLRKFLEESMLSSVFVPVATYHHEKRNQEDEFVALVEGAHFPFFGTAFSVEKFQFNNDYNIEEEIDHSKYAIRLAMRLGNLFVDEARLSTNLFRTARDEYNALIQNYDSKIVDKEDRESGALVQGEIYLF